MLEEGIEASTITMKTSFRFPHFPVHIQRKEKTIRIIIMYNDFNGTPPLYSYTANAIETRIVA